MAIAKKILLYITGIFFYLFFILVIAEITCRSMGYKPFAYAADPEVEETTPKSDDEWDPTLGFKLADGDFTITKNHKYTYHASHRNGKRVSGIGNLKGKYKRKVAFLGCSCTYGQMLEDSCTHPYILQQMFLKAGIGLEVENWGVGAYGPGHFYLQAQKMALDTDIGTVIINYGIFHNYRTACSRMWRKDLATYVKDLSGLNQIYWPAYTINSDSLVLEYKCMKYDFLPFQKQSAFIELLDRWYCNFENRDAKKITRLVLKKTIELLTQKGKKVYLTPIQSDPETLEMVKDFESEGVNVIYYGINILDKKYNLYPIDDHPNYEANKVFASKIFEKMIGSQ